MASIEAKLQHVGRRIVQACTDAGREAEGVTLLAVSKTFGADAVREAHAAGQRCFGENYVQEALNKIDVLDGLRPRPEWHLIGPLQSNKTAVVAAAFDWVHTIDRLKTAERLAAQRPSHLAPLKVCLQVNVSGEASKGGVASEALPALARDVAALPNLVLCGLMSIPAPADTFEAQRVPHRRLRALRDALEQQLGLSLPTLSMGMSADLEAAIAEGATLVRVGSAIFGQRVAA